MPAATQTSTTGPVFQVRTTLIHDRPVELDLAELRRRLARPGPPVSLYGDQGARPAASGLRRAAVLVPIVARAEELAVLFTQRTAHLRDHSGQVSFPGGRAEPQDASAEITALRETREEIGLEPGRVEIVGRLPDYRTRTGYLIAPVIGVLSPPLELRPDAEEVESVFEVPLAFLLDPRNHARDSRLWQGERRWFYAIRYRERTIWGATAGMLVNLWRHLVEAR